MRDERLRGRLAILSRRAGLNSSENQVRHTTTEKFENGALFLRLGMPSILIRHENRALRKRSSNRRNLKTPALRFIVEEKYFENEAFRK